jgi:hypothetical protein
MKTILQLIRVLMLLLALPLEISNASKRGAYLRIKKRMAVANLF